MLLHGVCGTTLTMVKQRAAVSSLGRFRSVRGVVSTPKPSRSKYVRVAVNGKRHLIHRLIAAAFNLSKTDNQTEVNHKDGNPSNNRLENLEWTTRSQNVLHSYKTNLNRASSAARTSKPVLARSVGCEEWIHYPSQQDASRILGVQPSSVHACIRGKYKQCKGYEFKEGPSVEPPLLDGEEWNETLNGAKVSSCGRVQSSVGIVFTPKPCQKGYIQVNIASSSYSVHRLVAEAFLTSPPSSAQVEVNHKDGNPSNNRLDNLEWCTRAENVKHSYDTNSERASSSVRQAKPVRGRLAGGEEWTLYRGGSREAARALGTHHGNVIAVCSGRRRSAKGYVFEYDSPTEPSVLEGEVWAEIV